MKVEQPEPEAPQQASVKPLSTAARDALCKIILEGIEGLKEVTNIISQGQGDRNEIVQKLVSGILKGNQSLFVCLEFLEPSQTTSTVSEILKSISEYYPEQKLASQPTHQPLNLENKQVADKIKALMKENVTLSIQSKLFSFSLKLIN